ncbi:Rop family plasmid primer RNA-binding protein, partial [Escherichia coli]|uniref:Rop family plasmid primer RNA-binding protein n=1 Tax=Escherichia coli TaxID=562 RepID=UPI003EE2AB61
IITPMNRTPPYTEASVTKQEKTALNMARFIRGQTLTLLEKLNAKTWGVRYHEDSNGRFLVLPKGMKAETNWTKDNGKLNAVRL